jgi:rhamnogalacturonyl hydrolase YesR
MGRIGWHPEPPLNEAAWGRGNGVAALGLALSLDYLPADDRLRARHGTQAAIWA